MFEHLSIHTIIHIVVALAFPPFLLGVINRTKAIFGGRRGQPLLRHSTLRLVVYRGHSLLSSLREKYGGRRPRAVGARNQNLTQSSRLKVNEIRPTIGLPTLAMIGRELDAPEGEETKHRYRGQRDEPKISPPACRCQ